MPHGLKRCGCSHHLVQFPAKIWRQDCGVYARDPVDWVFEHVGQWRGAAWSWRGGDCSSPVGICDQGRTSTGKGTVGPSCPKASCAESNASRCVVESATAGVLCCHSPPGCTGWVPRLARWFGQPAACAETVDMGAMLERARGRQNQRIDQAAGWLIGGLSSGISSGRAWACHKRRRWVEGIVDGVLHQLPSDNQKVCEGIVCSLPMETASGAQGWEMAEVMNARRDWAPGSFWHSWPPGPEWTGIPEMKATVGWLAPNHENRGGCHQQTEAAIGAGKPDCDLQLPRYAATGQWHDPMFGQRARQNDYPLAACHWRCEAPNGHGERRGESFAQEASSASAWTRSRRALAA